MVISLIAAMDPDQVIGRGNELPWRISEDLKRFRALTMGKPIIMGRRTFESIGRPLPGRRNVVVSRTRPCADGLEFVPTLNAAIELCWAAPEIMICGGASLYAEGLPRANRMYITHLENRFDGDVFFPEVQWSQWQVVAREVVRAPETNHPHHNVTYDRKPVAGEECDAVGGPAW